MLITDLTTGYSSDTTDN